MALASIVQSILLMVFGSLQKFLPFNILGMLGIGGGDVSTSTSTSTTKPKTVALSFNLDDLQSTKSPYTLAVGSTLTGKASANRTTGFDWVVDADSAKNCGPEGSIKVE